MHWHRAGRDLHRAHVVRITSTLRSLSRCTRSLSRCSRSGLGRNALRLATGSCRSEVHVAGHERGSALERRQRCGSSCSWHARLAICQARIRRARYARYARYRCTPLDAARAGLSPHLRVAHRASHNAQGRGGGERGRTAISRSCDRAGDQSQRTVTNSPTHSHSHSKKCHGTFCHFYTIFIIHD